VPDAVCWSFVARIKKNEESVKKKNRIVNCGIVFTILVLKKRISELPLVIFVAHLQQTVKKKSCLIALLCLSVRV